MTAVTFPAVVQRLNMLRPARFVRSAEQGPGFSTYVASWTGAANYFKDWLPFNLADEGGTNIDTAAFGAFTTAPNGSTDTARLLVDTTANSIHSFIAGWLNVGQLTYGKIRLAGIFKYAGRRVVLTITTQPSNAGGAGKYGCKAVFDLAGGRVAVDTAAFGSPDTAWTLFPAQIYTAETAGWHVCIVDAICTMNSSGGPAGLYGQVSLDNGTGTAAESSTYAGDGTSGVYGWRSNMLPDRAWNLGTVAFFDDFDDPAMGNIDLTDSRAPGFDWYIHNSNPAYSYLRDDIPVTNPATLSVANSVLTCSSNPLPLFMGTFASTWNDVTPSPGYVGKGWVVPALFEGRAKWDISLSNQNDEATMWTASLEYLTGGRTQDQTMPGREYDFFETRFGTYPRSSMLYYPPGPVFTAPNQSIGNSSVGLNVWNAVHDFQGTTCSRLGLPYQSLVSPNIGHPPESSPAQWGTYVQKTNPGQVGVDYPVGDYENFHDYATLWLPYDSTTGDLGQIVQFYDGVMVSFPLVYGPGLTGEGKSDVIHTSDAQQMPLLLGCGPTLPISFDWVRVTQLASAQPAPTVVDTRPFVGGTRGGRPPFHWKGRS